MELKYLFIFVATVVFVAVLLSVLFGIPYIYTICGFSAWAAMGHLITIDDDRLGGFSNPEEDKNLWNLSLLLLLLKFVVLAVLLLVALNIPSVSQLGA